MSKTIPKSPLHGKPSIGGQWNLVPGMRLQVFIGDGWQNAVLVRQVIAYPSKPWDAPKGWKKTDHELTGYTVKLVQDSRQLTVYYPQMALRDDIKTTEQATAEFNRAVRSRGDEPLAGAPRRRPTASRAKPATASKRKTATTTRKRKPATRRAKA